MTVRLRPRTPVGALGSLLGRRELKRFGWKVRSQRRLRWKQPWGGAGQPSKWQRRTATGS